MSSVSNRLVHWMVHHDESWLFVAIYLGLAVGLSVFVSLFWLLVVALFHLLLEVVRQAYYRDTAGSVLLHAFWEIKMDLGLILLALSLVLYLEVVLGLLGLQSAARAAAVGRVTHTGVRAGSRAAQSATRAVGGGGSAIEQWIRGFLLTVDDMVRVLFAILLLRERKRQLAMQRAERGKVTDAEEQMTSSPTPVVPLEESEGSEQCEKVAPAGAEIGSAVEQAANDSRAETAAADGEVVETAGNDVPEAAGDEVREVLGTEAREIAGNETDENSNGTRGPGSDAALERMAAHSPAEAAMPGCARARNGEAADVQRTGEALEPAQCPLRESIDVERSERQVPSADGSTEPAPAWRGSWAMSDLVGLIMVGVGASLLAAAPYLTSHEWETAVMTIAQELRPLAGLESPPDP